MGRDIRFCRRGRRNSSRKTGQPGAPPLAPNAPRRHLHYGLARTLITKSLDSLSTVPCTYQSDTPSRSKAGIVNE